MLALTEIERATFQFSSVQLGLSECKHVQLVRGGLPEICHRVLACQRGASAVTSDLAHRPRSLAALYQVTQPSNC